jgi:hypothetical protein
MGSRSLKLICPHRRITEYQGLSLPPVFAAALVDCGVRRAALTLLEDTVNNDAPEMVRNSRRVLRLDLVLLFDMSISDVR